MNDLDEAVKKAGFFNAADFHGMVAAADISSPEKLAAFKRWQDADGTRDGLAKLVKPYAVGDPVMVRTGAWCGDTGKVCRLIHENGSYVVDLSVGCKHNDHPGDRLRVAFHPSELSRLTEDEFNQRNQRAAKHAA